MATSDRTDRGRPQPSDACSAADDTGHPTSIAATAHMEEHAGLIAIILICGLFADSLLMKQKVKNLDERVERLERDRQPSK